MYCSYNAERYMFSNQCPDALVKSFSINSALTRRRIQNAGDPNRSDHPQGVPDMSGMPDPSCITWIGATGAYTDGDIYQPTSLSPGTVVARPTSPDPGEQCTKPAQDGPGKQNCDDTKPMTVMILRTGSTTNCYDDNCQGCTDPDCTDPNCDADYSCCRNG